MTIHSHLGQRIKEVRQRLNLTLKDVEARVDVSATHVSEIERGKTTPTIGALSRIADALEVDPTIFLAADDQPKAQIVRDDERDEISFARDGYRLRALSAPVSGQDLSAGLVTWIAGAEAPMRNHGGEQFVRVLDGSVVVEIADERHELRAGDCIHFRADRPHRVVNEGERDATGIWASCPKFGV